MNRKLTLLSLGMTCQLGLLAQVNPLLGGRGAVMPILPTEAGRPFSAKISTEITQTLMDGTHVSHATTLMEYRDPEGRVRTETSEPASIVIRDPVAGVTYRLDPLKKSFTKSEAAESGRGGRGGSTPSDDKNFILPYRSDPADVVEDLGTATVNGVSASGTRVTTTVPRGAIGNDREFRSTSERWFSPDLNLLIKSASTDPRFGTTSYELTNISRVPPDPSLFRIPADYKPQPSPISKVIEAIEFRGAQNVPPELLKAAVGSKVGDVFDEAAVRRDFTALWKTGRFEDIQVKTDPGTHGGVVVVFVMAQR